MIDPAEIAAPPSHVHIPARDGSLLNAVTAVASKVGRSMDDAQLLAVDVLTSSWSDSRPASLEAGVIAARQNLKTYVLENIALTVMTRPGNVRRAVWSAHEVATAQETFLTFLDLIERYEWLAARVVAVSRATGREGIVFTGGRRLRFRARIKTGGRGLAGDVIFLDEAFALEPEHMGSLIPILSTRPFGRVLYGSSAPLANSDILRRLILRGRTGGAGAPAYVEWSAPGSMAEPGCPDGRKCTHEPGTPGCSLDDEDRIRAANPAVESGRITMEYIRGERLALPPAEFARERLVWGDEPGKTNGRLSALDWKATAEDVRPTGPKAFFITIEPGMRSATIAVAADHPGGSGSVPHVELADHRPGVAWLGERVRDLRDKNPDAPFGAGKAGPVAGMLNEQGELVSTSEPDEPDADAVGAEGVPIELVTSADWVLACGLIERLMSGRTMTHHDDELLRNSLAGLAARERDQGAWDIDWRKSTGNPAPFAAGVGAMFLLDKHREDDYDLLDSAW